jgi:hypothetical protein
VSALVFGCSQSTSNQSAASGTYTSSELRTSFRVPKGWELPSSWSVTKRKSPWVARFEAPEGDAAITAAEAPYAGINCAAGAKAALRAADGAALDPDKEFELKASSETVSAGTGSTSSAGREGLARFFCFGKTAVVVEAAATKAAASRRRAELESIIDSVSYEQGSDRIALRPPSAPTEPTFFQHVVRFRGETLGQIAEWYTGSYDNWKKLSRYNEDTPVPNVVLKTGRTINIPVELVVRQDPLPQPKRPKMKPAESKTAERAETAVGKESAAGVEPKPSDEEEAEATGQPKAEEEAPPDIPSVIGPR